MPLSTNKRIIVHKAIFILINLLILDKEISCLPSPLHFFRLMYNADYSIFQFFLWVIWAFFLAPVFYLLLVILWYLKYQTIEPTRISAIFLKYTAFYCRMLLNIVIYLIFNFYALFCNNIIFYAFFRCSRVFPSSISANIIYICFFIMLNLCIFLLMMGKTLSIIIKDAIKVEAYSMPNKFLLKNWHFILGFFSINSYYLLNFIYLYKRVTLLRNDTNNFAILAIEQSLLNGTLIIFFMSLDSLLY